MTRSAAPPPRRDRPVRGRGPELDALTDAIATAAGGRGAVVELVGAPGLGKTRLLREAVAMARRAGLRAGYGITEHVGGTGLPYEPLLDALYGGEDPVLDPAARPDPTAGGTRHWLLDELETALEAAALRTPLLICVDDVQWADRGTRAALASLPLRLAGEPIAWVVARRPEEAGGAPSRDGAVDVALAPLDDAAIAAVVADHTRAPAGGRLLQVAAGTGGNPFLLNELLLGLEEEGRLGDDGADLHDDELPLRLQQTMQARLSAVSPVARQLAGVSSVLGRRFSPVLVADMTGVEVARVFGALDELCAADLLDFVAPLYGYQHDLLRQAVRETLPSTVVRALVRQAAEERLSRGATPVEVAAGLAESALPGDRAAVAVLLDAIRTLAGTDPAAAAALGRRALEIADDEDPSRVAVMTETAIALHAADGVLEGRAFVEEALAQKLSPVDEANLRLALAMMQTLSPDVRAEAARPALDLPGLDPVLRGQLIASYGLSVIAAGRPAPARAALELGRAEGLTDADPQVAFKFSLIETGLDYDDGRFAAAVGAIDAVIARSGGPSRRRAGGGEVADLWHSEMLAAFDALGEAAEIAAAAARVARERRQHWETRLWEQSSGRFAFMRGELAEAAATLTGLFAEGADFHLNNGADAGALVALARTALHTGDHRVLQRSLRLAAQVPADATPDVRRHLAWPRVVEADAREDHAAVRELLGALGGDVVLPTFPMDPMDTAQLTGIALRAELPEVAAWAARVAGERAERTPGRPALAGAAAHARGLVGGDPEMVKASIAQLGRSQRPLAHALACADLGALLRRLDEDDEAITHLDRALEIYAALGATFDAARMRGALRELGVRRAVPAVAEEAGGLEALTQSERLVVRLVAEGLTNREVADRLFLSRHTVGTHLRHAFAKLGVRSRAELAGAFALLTAES